MQGELNFLRSSDYKINKCILHFVVVVIIFVVVVIIFVVDH